MCIWNGLAIHMDCPNGLYYNPSEEVCDYKFNVDCNISVEEISTTPDTMVNSTVRAQPTTISHINSNVTVDNVNSTTLVPSNSSTLKMKAETTLVVKTKSEPTKCPTIVGEYPELLPDPESCSSYYKCTWNGLAVHMNCPGQLLFNPTIGVCDYPTKVDCNKSSVSTVATTTTTTIKPNVNNTKNSTDKIPVSVSTTTPKSNVFTTLANVGSTVNTQINSTTQGSPNSTAEIRLKRAVSTNLASKQLTISTSNSTKNSTTHSTTPTTLPPTTAANNNSSSIPPAVLEECEKLFGTTTEAIIISNMIDCSTFYICESQTKASLVSCPENLYFNSKLKVCDFKFNVECKVLNS